MKYLYDEDTGVLRADPEGAKPSPVDGVTQEEYERFLADIARAKRLGPVRLILANAKHVRRWLREVRAREAQGAAAD